MNKRISPRAYIKKTKKSTLVFNIPSVGGCHGWKLAEYFAMGKAIISFPLNNAMPTGFENGKNVFIIKNEIELEYAIKELYSNHELVKKLENESSIYFNTVLSPTSVIERIISKSFE